MDSPHPDLRVAFGPEMPGWGSWDWCGADVVAELRRWVRVETFTTTTIPSADVVVFVKHAPSSWPDWLAGSRVIYAPIDFFGSAADFDVYRGFLTRCSRLLIHCERLRPYLSRYGTVEYIDHHVKFVAEQSSTRRRNGPILWVGVRSNLPALVDWVNQNGLARELIVLTNPEVPGRALAAASYGFRPGIAVRIEEWSPELHIGCLSNCSAAIDVKAVDFRSRHKPPAKAIDFIASGVPLAMPKDSSSVEHLAKMGFDVADVSDHERWLSAEYLLETQRFGAGLRELLSRDRVARRWLRIIREVAAMPPRV